MMDFNYYAPTQVVFGRDSETKVGQLVKKYGGFGSCYQGYGGVLRVNLYANKHQGSYR